MVRCCRSLAVFAVMYVLCAGIPASAGTPEDAINRRMRVKIAADIKTHGQTFQGPGNVPSALLKAIEGKRLVGLGEGSHGTSELHTFSGNLILAMAKKGRVIVFLEDQFGSVASLNQFVQGAGVDSDLGSKMKELFGIHRTMELAAFFRKARTFNTMAPVGANIAIYGVDIRMWPGPNDVTPNLLAFSTTHNLRLDGPIATCASYIQDPKSQTAESRASFVAAAARIQLAVSGLASSLPGLVEAAVMANNLVHLIADDVTSNHVFAKNIVDALGNTPAVICGQGMRDSAMAENIKLLMDGKIPTSGAGVYWAHNAHVGRVSFLDGDPDGFPSAWGSTGSILNVWLGEAYFPLAVMTGKGAFRAHLVDKVGAVQPFQPILAPPIHPDCLNAIAASVFSKPVFFHTNDVALLGFTRPEFVTGGAYEVLHPEHLFVRTIPGMAYAGVISFPVSTAAQGMQ